MPEPSDEDNDFFGISATTNDDGVNEAQDRELYETATLLGQDLEMSSVDFAFGAQAEVVLAQE